MSLNSDDRPPDDLADGFAAPPQIARPLVWWHWMDGNVSKEGIDNDLQWMKHVGIGGLQHFDGAFDTPRVVEQRLAYMSPPWRSAFRYAVRRADELGLEFAISSSPGWSETGGPWVEAPDGMKKLVWSETRLARGRPFSGSLQPPPSVAGPFQHMSAIDIVSFKESPGPRFYRDAAVIAYRTPESWLTESNPVAGCTSAGPIAVDTLLNPNNQTPISLPISEGSPAWVVYDYGRSLKFRAVSLAKQPQFSTTTFTWDIEASQDGRTFQKIAELPGDYTLHHTTASFPEVAARYLRLTITAVPLKLWFQFAANAPGTQRVPPFSEGAREVQLFGLAFFRGARVHRFEEKAAFAIAPRYYMLDSPPSASDEVVDPKDVLDITPMMNADGVLTWTPPPGDWTVLRLGYSLTGKTNHPASPEATGLEVDKLDRAAVKRYLDFYYSTFECTVGAEWIGKKGIGAFLTDSIEARGQNWTGALVQEFNARRGYDPTLWLPSLTGVIIGDSSRTDRFLWDFRKTLSELMSESHYGQIANSAHSRGLQYYSESLEGYPTMALGDDLDMRQHADIPMAAIWTNYKASEQDGILNHMADIRGAASVAHVFGKTIVGAECLTSGHEPWAFSPATLRPVIDLAFVLGVNRPIIHTSVHQPVEKKPGMTLGPYGQHFTRHETWGALAGPWVTYLSRSAYLLQQGKFVADVAWYYGEEGSLAGLCADAEIRDLPEGYGFDFVNANILLNHLSADGGRLVSSGGASWRLLYLGGSSARMTLPALRKIARLCQEGIAISGLRPTGSPSLGDLGHEDEYRNLVEELWDGGVVGSDPDPNAALTRLGVDRDFSYSSENRDTIVKFLHRTLSDGELYFLTNRTAKSAQIEASFRVIGMNPELWHADNGHREAVLWRVEGAQTIVPISLYANQSLFVLFRKGTKEASAQPRGSKESLLTTIAGSWQVTFEPGRGAPAEPLNWSLGCLTGSENPGVKYFSGIATYRKSFVFLSDEMQAEDRVLLDLGEVHELAEVTLNGKMVGVVWHAPFRLDVSDVIVAGVNVLEIRVANLWVNRLIGDNQPGADSVAYTVTSTYTAEAPLRRSGLLGPVALKCLRYLN